MIDMNLDTLKLLLDVSCRSQLFAKILNELEKVKKINFIDYQAHEISDGIIPTVKIAKNSKLDEISHVKVFIGAQHNEYNGLFGILEFLRLIYEGVVEINDILQEDQILYFIPLMNPFGFLNPNKDNKSGYYLKNGTNLNRFWRRAFAPNYKDGENDLDKLPTPEQVILIKKIFQKYWEKENISLYILDFHETSLLERFPIELAANLNLFYKFDHWLKEGIVLNIIKLYSIPYYRKPLFYKCNPSADHTHLNLTHKQFETVFEKLREYMSRNQGKGKLPFYFCYNNKSREYCSKLANIVYNKLKEKLWETYYPAFDHYFINHGCFVNMSDATSRPRVYSMELETQKQFFNIFDEIQKSKSDPNYYEIKLNLINVSIELVLETIKEMINLF
ncbi:MAG: hypothetical protein ACFFDY_02780 [Candidatus Thorarchaeota archaeon]